MIVLLVTALYFRIPYSFLVINMFAKIVIFRYNYFILTLKMTIINSFYIKEVKKDNIYHQGCKANTILC